MFGRYRLVEVIGQGGMGTVYRAHDTVIGRDVAIKVLPPDLASEPGYQERFRREAHTAARLAEPHVIPIYDTGEIEGRLYLVMPVVDGMDLESLLERDGALPPPRAVGIIEQLGAALHTAHAAGLVHRDVKPSNALVTAREFVYLIDFGIAHDGSATKLTNTGSVVGTYAYMAPERFSTGTADARADIYALACVLFECLTGQLPFPGNSLEQQIAGHLTAPPPRPSLLNPALGTGLDAVIARGMAKDPEQRYQSAKELASSARQALIGPPTAEPWPTPYPGAGPPIPRAPTMMPTSPGWPVRPRRSGRRRIVAAAAAAVALVAAAVVAIVAARSGPTKPTAGTTSTSPPPTVAEDRLDSILLTPQELDTILGTDGLQPKGSIDRAPSVWRSSVPDCDEASNPGLDSAYRGSGYTSIRYEVLTQQGDNPANGAFQAASTFGSADQALAFVKNAATKMGACAGRSISDAEGTHTFQTTYGKLVGDAPAITLLHTEAGAMTCQRALRAVSNVVIDVSACGYHISDQGQQMADKMAAKVTGPAGG